MASYKIYQSGNNLEIYEFEHMQDDTGVDALKEYNALKEEYAYLQIAFKSYVATIDRLQKKAIEYYEQTGVIYSDVIAKVRRDNYDMLKRYSELARYFADREEKKELSVSEKDALKVKRRYQTLRDNANNLKRMIRAYFSYKAFMVTLTYSDKYACTAEQIDKSDRRVRAMWEKLRKVYPDVQFAGVRELQKKRGVIHYHYIVESSIFYDSYKESGAAINKRKNDAHKMFENQFEKDYWKFGFVDVRNVVGIDDTGAYLAKYMTKAKIKEMEWLENRRLILRSENIKKIEPVADSTLVGMVAENIEDIKIIAQTNIIDNRERKSVFCNGYESQYTGQVYYMEIHLDRLTEKEKNALHELLDRLE